MDWHLSLLSKIAINIQPGDIRLDGTDLCHIDKIWLDPGKKALGLELSDGDGFTETIWLGLTSDREEL